MITPLKTSVDGAGEHTLVVEVTGAALGGGGSVDVSGLATETTLVALKNAVLSQIEIASTLWTDDSGAFYVRRDTVSEATGTAVITFYTPAGAAATPGTGLRPASGSKDYEITSTGYTASASGTGYTAGDALIHAIVLETSGAAPVVSASIWLNITTGLVLAAPPAGANVTLQSPLPTGAATSAKQDTIIAAFTALATSAKQDAAKVVFDAILAKISADPATAAKQDLAKAVFDNILVALGTQTTAQATSAKQDLIVAGLTAVHDAVVAGGGGGGGSTPTGTVGAPSTSVVSVQGIQGGRTIQTGVGAFKSVLSKAAAVGTPVAIEPGELIVGETLMGGGSVWTNDRGGQNVHVTNGTIAIRGNQTTNILVLFEQRWNAGAIGVGDATLVAGDSASLIMDNVVTEIAAALVLEPVAHVGDFTLYQFDTEFNWFTNTYSGGAGGAGLGQGHGGIILVALDAPVNFTAGQSASAVTFNINFNSVGSFYAA